MRLIDANELDSVVLRLNTEEDARITRLEYKLIDSVIFEFPTIEAVPIKWLEEKLTNHPEIPYAVTDGINAVLEMWREEND